MSKKTNRSIVYINGRFLTQEVTGVQRYAINLLLQLDELSMPSNLLTIEFVLLVPKGDHTDLNLRNIPIKKIGRFQGHAWEQFDLYFFVGRSLLLCFCNTAPIFKRNQFVVIHDTAVFRYPEAYDKKFVIWYKIMGIFIGKVASKVLTVSEFSRQELQKCLRINPNKISIISPGLTFKTDAQEVKILDKLSTRKLGFFLAVGSMDPRKNLNGLINAFELICLKGVDLIIVGSNNNKVFKSTHIDYSSKENLKFTGYINDGELAALYYNAIAYILPSFYEGFGLPIIEAMSMGCPVLASNTASLPEVGGQAAIYFDPTSEEDIATKMKQIYLDQILRDKLIQLGRVQTQKFSYHKSAQKLLASIFQSKIESNNNDRDHQEKD